MALLMRIVSSSVEVANHAGNAIRRIMLTGKLDIVDKATKNEQFDPQTEADRTAQSLIIGSLQHQYPELVIVGEEEGHCAVPEDKIIKDYDKGVLEQVCPDNLKELQAKDFTVWVDPLDATKAFTEGQVENVTVLIGISAHGKPVAGVIHQPFYKTDVGRTVWGVVGLGAFGIIKPPVPVRDRSVIITTKSHFSKPLSNYLATFPDAEIMKTDGSGYKILSVIEGVADAYLYPQLGTKRWDTCAAEAILRAIGGTLTDALGNDIDYSRTGKKYHMNWTGLVATLYNHEYFITKMPETAKQELRELLASKLGDS